MRTSVEVSLKGDEWLESLELWQVGQVRVAIRSGDQLVGGDTRLYITGTPEQLKRLGMSLAAQAASFVPKSKGGQPDESQVRAS